MAQRNYEVEREIQNKILPLLWEDGSSFSSFIYFIKDQHKDDFVGWWNKVTCHLDGNSLPYHESDFELINTKIGEVEFFVIQMNDTSPADAVYYCVFAYDFVIRKRIYFVIQKNDDSYGLYKIFQGQTNQLEITSDNEIGQLVNQLMKGC